MQKMENKCKISKCAKYTQGNVDSLANWLIHQLQKKAKSDVVKQKNQYAKYAKQNVKDPNVQNIHKEELASLLIDWSTKYRQR